MSCCCQQPEVTPAKPLEKGCSTPPPPRNDGRRWLKFGAAAAIAGLAMTLSLALNLTPPEGTTRTLTHSALIALDLACFALLGGPVLHGAWEALRRGRIVTDQLFLAGMAGAFGASLLTTWRGQGDIYYEVVIILLAIHALGRLLTERQRAAATATLDAWRATLERCTVVLPGGGTKSTTASCTQPGEIIRVLPGETAPLDGIVKRGCAYVLETAHSGEPFPAARRPDDRLLAGSTVLDGPLDLTVTSAGTSREVDRLAAAIAALSREKSQIENLADRAVRVFLPSVIALCAVTFLAWWPAAGAGRALFNALAVLLVACPCALGIALPLAHRRGLQGLASLGLVPRSTAVGERLATITRVVFDKTGTLTELGLEAGALHLRDGEQPDLRAMIAEIQRHTRHPVARPFWAWKETLPVHTKLKSVVVLPGQGVRGIFMRRGESVRVEIGNVTLLATPEPASEQTRRLYVLLDGRCVATVDLLESPRPGLAQLMDDLRSAGIRLALLTGDVALPPALRELPLEVFTQLSAAEKARRVAAWEEAGERVLFIGDGLNDTEAMSRATVGLALSDAHDTARDAADGAWLSPDFTRLPAALRTAATTRRTLRRIIGFAFAYNGIGLALAAGGVLHPVAAALLMLASSLTVTTLANTEPGSKARRLPRGAVAPILWRSVPARTARPRADAAPVVQAS
jgi:P-type E1-E2 ATPase